MEIAGQYGPVSVTTAAVVLTAMSPCETIFNITGAVTQPLPSAPIDGQRHIITNYASSTASVTVSGNINGAAGATVAQAAGTTFTYVYSAALATWVKR